MGPLRRFCGWLADVFGRLSGEQVQVTRGLTLDAHPLATEVTLRLDRPRKLRFTMREAVELRKRTGISVWTGEGTPSGRGLDLGALDEVGLLELLTICCEAEDPEVTAEQLAPHLAGEKLVDAVAALMVLLGDFHPDVSEGEPENPLVASALIHLMSGSTGRSQRKRSGSTNPSTGGLPRA